MQKHLKTKEQFIVKNTYHILILCCLRITNCIAITLGLLVAALINEVRGILLKNSPKPSKHFNLNMKKVFDLCESLLSFS